MIYFSSVGSGEREFVKLCDDFEVIADCFPGGGGSKWVLGAK